MPAPLVSPLTANISRKLAGEVLKQVKTYRTSISGLGYSNTPWKQTLNRRVGASTAQELTPELTQVYDAAMIDDIAARFHINPDNKIASVLDDNGIWNKVHRLTGDANNTTESMIRMGGHQEFAISNVGLKKMFKDNAQNLRFAIKDSWRLGAYKGYKNFDASVLSPTGETRVVAQELKDAMLNLKDNGIISHANYTRFFADHNISAGNARAEINALSVQGARPEILERIKADHFQNSVSNHKSIMRDDALGGILSRFQVNRVMGRRAGGVTPHSIDVVPEDSGLASLVTGSRAIVPRRGLSRGEDYGMAWGSWRGGLGPWTSRIGADGSPENVIKNAGFLDDAALKNRRDYIRDIELFDASDPTGHLFLPASTDMVTGGHVGGALFSDIRRLSQGGDAAIRAADEAVEATTAAFTPAPGQTGAAVGQNIYANDAATIARRKDFAWDQIQGGTGSTRAPGESKSLFVKLKADEGYSDKALKDLSGNPITAAERKAQPSYFGSKQFSADTNNLQINETIGRRIEYHNPLKHRGKPQYLWMDLERVGTGDLGMKRFQFKLSPWRKVINDRNGQEVWSPEILEGKIIMGVPTTTVGKFMAEAIDTGSNKANASKITKLLNRETSKKVGRVRIPGSHPGKINVLEMDMAFRETGGVELQKAVYDAQGKLIKKAVEPKTGDLMAGLERMVDKSGRNLLFNANGLSSDSAPAMIKVARMFGANAVVLPKNVWDKGNFLLENPWVLMKETSDLGQYGGLTTALGELQPLLQKARRVVRDAAGDSAYFNAKMSTEKLSSLNKKLEQVVNLVNKSQVKTLGGGSKRHAIRVPGLEGLYKKTRDGKLVFREMTEDNLEGFMGELEAYLGAKKNKKFFQKISSSGEDIHSHLAFDKTLQIITSVLPLTLILEGMESGNFPVLLGSGKDRLEL